MAGTIPLLEVYPELAEALPRVSLASLPTPVARLERLGTELGLDHFYVKRDDLSAAPYGGNKVRKLEFLLGQALHDGRKATITFGAAGSNHALATAIYAKQLGLRAFSMLGYQHNAHSVRKNLLRHYAAGAELYHDRHRPDAVGRAISKIFQRCKAEYGSYPLVIPAGGSSPLGILGFVNAAFELRAQVRAGRMPPPDRIYAACGTMGTVMGLLLGLRAADMDATVVAVRVTPPPFTDAARGRRLFETAHRSLREAAPSFPEFSFPESQFELRHEFYGEDYGLHTEAGQHAVRLARETDGLKLEGTYTGKAMAALIADAESGALDGQTALFWDTYNSHSLTEDTAGIDYRDLPQDFHRYFEEDVQPLDIEPSYKETGS